MLLSHGTVLLFLAGCHSLDSTTQPGGTKNPRFRQSLYSEFPHNCPIRHDRRQVRVEAVLCTGIGKFHGVGPAFGACRPSAIPAHRPLYLRGNHSPHPIRTETARAARACPISASACRSCQTPRSLPYL